MTRAEQWIFGAIMSLLALSLLACGYGGLQCNGDRVPCRGGCSNLQINPDD